MAETTKAPKPKLLKSSSDKLAQGTPLIHSQFGRGANLTPVSDVQDSGF